MNKQKSRSIFSKWETAGYDILKVETAIKKDKIIEALVTIERDGFEVGDSLNLDWTKIVELALQDEYVAIPVDDSQMVRKQFRLIHKDAILLVNEKLIELDKELRKSYWVIQGDREVESLMIEIDKVLEDNWEIEAEIKRIALDRTIEHVFEDGEIDQKWFNYKTNIKMLIGRLNWMDPAKFPKLFHDRMNDLAVYYEF